MIRTFIAYDDNDVELGDYFESSHNDIQAVIAANGNISNVSIQGLDCTEVFINNTIKPLNGSRFVFIALSHGNEKELVSHEVYISSNNSTTFTNCLFYTCACSTGNGLGDNLISAGCLTFIGYFDTVLVNVDYYQVFFTCQNYCIKSFFSNDETIEVSFNKMINFYNSEIDHLIVGTIDDVLAASSLIGNRDCLVIFGNTNVARTDFSF
ncbi:MAG: hypothetical protein ABIO55_17965 [Ginsengibacter sp.]